ncbi:mannosyl-3-phosphoglycerate phosphatase [Oceanicola sp. 502str15]|uniref:HAD-IIB family hydrolase n=1 Tax=Oceanicola sp. 502str15 TaxID=2696061 RepID=UPI002094CED6|nr:HAD-IIB family hydrolase [Oceanicola sp. 502str15]MCO6381142.1 HAD-IIB family hydrolase [Oceanicola sp. 502str15]
MSNESTLLRPELIVFTDLDGTLLDHRDYSFAAAQSALECMAKKNLPLVLASSKTSSEMKELAQNLPCEPAALIVENGAGVVWPGEEGIAAPRHTEILAALAGLPAALRSGFEGFSDWGTEGIAHQTGLALREAELAARREFSEPGLWRGSDGQRDEFLAALEEAGITARQGGRYLTLSFGADKADRLREVASRLAPTAHVLALGDAPNDIGMLEAADTGVIVANPHGAGIATLPGESTGKIRRTTLPGPEGWNAAVLETIVTVTSAHGRA